MNKQLDLDAPIFAHIHVDKVRLPANFHPNRRHTWPSFSGSNIRNEYFDKCIMYSSLEAYRHGCSGHRADTGEGRMIPVATISRGVRTGVGLLFAKIC